MQMFARNLIREVRDVAIRSCDQLLAGSAAVPVGDRWRAAVQDDTVRDAVHLLIPDIVDEVMFALLGRGIDQGLIPLVYKDATGEVDLTEEGDGELSGWYDEWRQEYSQQRWNSYWIGDQQD